MTENSRTKGRKKHYGEDEKEEMEHEDEYMDDDDYELMPLGEEEKLKKRLMAIRGKR